MWAGGEKMVKQKLGQRGHASKNQLSQSIKGKTISKKTTYVKVTTQTPTYIH